jgi:hypothetical protein
MQGVRGSNPLSSTRHNATSTPALRPQHGRHAPRGRYGHGRGFASAGRRHRRHPLPAVPDQRPPGPAPATLAARPGEGPALGRQRGRRHGVPAGPGRPSPDGHPCRRGSPCAPLPGMRCCWAWGSATTRSSSSTTAPSPGWRWPRASRPRRWRWCRPTAGPRPGPASVSRSSAGASSLTADDLEAAADVDLGPVAPDRTHRLVLDGNMTIHRAARGARDGRLRRRQPRPVDAPLPQCRPPGRGDDDRARLRALTPSLAGAA